MTVYLVAEAGELQPRQETCRCGRECRGDIFFELHLAAACDSEDVTCLLLN
jgi:hypothetical protein